MGKKSKTPQPIVKGTKATKKEKEKKLISNKKERQAIISDFHVLLKQKEALLRDLNSKSNSSNSTSNSKSNSKSKKEEEGEKDSVEIQKQIDLLDHQMIQVIINY